MFNNSSSKLNCEGKNKLKRVPSFILRKCSKNIDKKEDFVDILLQKLITKGRIVSQNNCTGVLHNSSIEISQRIFRFLTNVDIIHLICQELIELVIGVCMNDIL